MSNKVDKYGIAAAIEIAGWNDGKRHRPTAAEQRDVLGYPVLGRKEARFDLSNQGKVTLFKRVIPNDTVFAEFTLADVVDAVNAQRALPF